MSFNPETLTYFHPSKERRICLITGGNSGIGYYTVLHLYLHGYVVYLAGRNKQRVERAIQDLKNEAIKRRETLTPQQLTRRHLGSLHFLEVDLLSLQSVEQALAVFKTREKILHLLILNAGIMAVPYAVTKDGFEVQLQTSYISHFLITDRVLKMMRDKELVSDPRIVFLSSIGHWFAFFHFSLDYQFNYSPDILFTVFRYGMAKCAGIQFVRTLSRRHPEIMSLAVHPGIVLNTNLFSHLTRLPIVGIIFWVVFQIFGWLIGVSNEEGSYSTLRCALSDDLDVNKDNGKYFSTLGVERQPSYIARNEDYGNESWAWTVQELKKRGYRIEI